MRWCKTVRRKLGRTEAVGAELTELKRGRTAPPSSAGVARGRTSWPTIRRGSRSQRRETVIAYNRLTGRGGRIAAHQCVVASDTGQAPRAVPHAKHAVPVVVRAVTVPPRGTNTPNYAEPRTACVTKGAQCHRPVVVPQSRDCWAPMGLWAHRRGKPQTHQLTGAEQGCIRREGTSEATPGAVRRAVGGGCRSGLGVVTVRYNCR